jgi:hypothetical protein
MFYILVYIAQSNILIHLVCLLVSDKAWEGGFVFLRAQRCKQDDGSGF